MGEARSQQELADRAVRAGERALAEGRTRVALDWLRLALRLRPWDKLRVSAELQRVWDEQP